MAKSDKKAVIEQLTGILSDTYVLLVKAHGYHWNVTGPGFFTLHNYFSSQYEGLLEAADEIAERIRILGKPAPGSMADFLKNSAINETKIDGANAQAILKDYLKAQETLRDRLAKALEVVDEADDDVTESLLIDRLKEHEKAIWMLRSQIG